MGSGFGEGFRGSFPAFFNDALSDERLLPAIRQGVEVVAAEGRAELGNDEKLAVVLFSGAPDSE